MCYATQQLCFACAQSAVVALDNFIDATPKNETTVVAANPSETLAKDKLEHDGIVEATKASIG